MSPLGTCSSAHSDTPNPLRTPAPSVGHLRPSPCTSRRKKRSLTKGAMRPNQEAVLHILQEINDDGAPDLVHEGLLFAFNHSSLNEQPKDEEYQEQDRKSHVPGFRGSVVLWLVWILSRSFTAPSLSVAPVGDFVDSSLALSNQHRAHIADSDDQHKHQDDHEDGIVTAFNKTK